MNKQLTILIVLAASLTSFLAGYLFMSHGSSTETIISQQKGNLIDRFNGVPGAGTPTPLPPGLVQAVPDPVLAPVAAQDGEAALYYRPGGVSRVDLETRQPEIVSQVSIPGLTSVIWSPDKNRVITLARTTKGQAYAYFDYLTHRHGNLSGEISDAAFSPDSQQLVVAVNQGSDAGAIETMDFTGQNPQLILKTRLTNIHVFWPRQDLLAFTAQDEGSDTQSLYTLTLDGNLTQVLSGLNQPEIRWSPNGYSFIYSESSSEIYSVNLDQKQNQDLSIQNHARNCAWSLDNSNVICATETQGETSITKTNTQTQTSTLLFSSLIISPQEVFLTRQEKFLGIVSATDHSLWEVKLP